MMSSAPLRVIVLYGEELEKNFSRVFEKGHRDKVFVTTNFVPSRFEEECKHGKVVIGRVRTAHQREFVCSLPIKFAVSAWLLRFPNTLGESDFTEQELACFSKVFSINDSAHLASVVQEIRDELFGPNAIPIVVKPKIVLASGGHRQRKDSSSLQVTTTTSNSSQEVAAPDASSAQPIQQAAVQRFRLLVTRKDGEVLNPDLARAYFCSLDPTIRLEYRPDAPKAFVVAFSEEAASVLLAATHEEYVLEPKAKRSGRRPAAKQRRPSSRILVLGGKDCPMDELLALFTPMDGFERLVRRGERIWVSFHTVSQAEQALVLHPQLECSGTVLTLLAKVPPVQEKAPVEKKAPSQRRPRRPMKPNEMETTNFHVLVRNVPLNVSAVHLKSLFSELDKGVRVKISKQMAIVSLTSQEAQNELLQKDFMVNGTALQLEAIDLLKTLRVEIRGMRKSEEAELKALLQPLCTVTKMVFIYRYFRVDVATCEEVDALCKSELMHNQVRLRVQRVFSL